MLVTDPEAVHFAVSSDLLYTILMYKTSADVLEGEITIPIANGKALFLVEGTYLPYEEFRHRIQYSETEKKFIGWNFIHPRGFVPHDTVDFSEMYPIARIKPEAYRRIAQTASQFWSENQEEVDPGREKGYILPGDDHARACLHSKTWWGTNFDDLTQSIPHPVLLPLSGNLFFWHQVACC